jgi:NAD(P)-dependent dehydrogenase (short-subunit alcohol dehydrogenase family)
MQLRFGGKIAVVTGAGQGIGKGIAARLASEGATVIIADCNEDTATEAAHQITINTGVQSHPYPIDILSPLATRKMVADLVSRFGKIDFLVNNAGVSQTKPLLDLTEADWDHVIGVNQRGMFFCLQTVAAQMVLQIPEEFRAGAVPVDLSSLRLGSGQPLTKNQLSNGKIVNISSISGRQGRPLSAHYAASKAAVISITQSAALALAPYNITVNAICPGVVPTAMWKQIDEDRSKLFGTQPGESMAAFINSIPLKRASTIEDVSAAVAFLCSTDSDCITGQALNVDGGFEMN